MARVLDETFLAPHPRTVLWWVQREQCRRCERFREVHIAATHRSAEHTVMHCEVGAPIVRRNGRTDYSACIDMRDENSACGPAALLFQPKLKV